MEERDTPAAVPDDDREDIRIAVVMNGGVSLAVWMGGVTTEINRLAGSSPDGPDDSAGRCEVYRELLETVGATVRVDVIAGTSAGGVNGAALAYAQVYRADLRPLGRVWAETGSFAKLLRSPLGPPAPSLLRGDGHLLPELAGAFDRLVPASLRPGRYVPPRRRPLDLMITATLMAGEQETFHDDFGNSITETSSAAVFRFTREADTPPEEDPFHFSHDVARRLALAGRCTSSFPVAFEPAFAPVGADGPDGLHPDLGGSGRRPAVASFAPSRHVLDGAILRNRPVEPALEAVYRQPAERQVRRLLMYVDPNPAGAVPEEAADPGDPPPLGDVLETLFRLPFEQSAAEEFRRIRENNARVRAYRARRPDQAGALDEELAVRLMPGYARARAHREAARIHAALTARSGTEPVGRTGLRTAGRSGQEPGDAAGRAAQGPQDRAGRWANEPPPPGGWRPEEIAELLAEGFPGEDVVRYVPAGLPGDGQAAADWDWGLEAVEQLGRAAVDVLKRAVWLAPPADGGLRRRLRKRRGELHEALAELRDSRRVEEAFWGTVPLPAPPPGAHRRRALRDLLTGALARTAPDGGPSAPAAEAARRGRIALRIAALLAGARDDLWRAADAAPPDGGTPPADAALPAGGDAPAGGGVPQGAGHPDGPPRTTVPAAAREAARLRALLRALVPRDGERPPAAVLRRMLAADVCRLAAGGEPPEVEQEVVLQQISARTPNPFGGPAEPGKLAGIRLGQFGAFYKKSWRVGDWIWGRLDGATRMVQAVLDPARLLQLGLSSPEVLRRLRRAAVGGAFAGELGERFDGDRERIERELAFLDAGEGPETEVPAELTATVLAVVRRLHAEILAEELAGLAEAVREDLEAGARRDSVGHRFLEIWRDRPSRPSAEYLFAAFAGAGTGQERFADEIGTPLFLATAGRALAVGASVLGSALGVPRLAALPWSVADAARHELLTRIRTGRREAAGLLDRLRGHRL
ncbi:hypothetical protein GCM10010466_53360 [Planomonospora alba]|uniref:PNPLA domain-containing protein n=1 Tax=Planomonospora alba TaxID=161354 RepID=A0ABP6NSK2_9ACTN